MDDLLDLNWSSPGSSSAPAKPLTPALQPSKPAPSPSAFDFLAKPSTGTTTNGAAPNYYNSTAPRPSSSSSTPLAKAPTPVQPKPKAAAPAPTGDAFSSLLGMGGGASSTRNLTMAQKQAQMEDERRRKEEHEKAQFAGLGSWEQFGSGATSAGPSQASYTARTSGGNEISTPPPPLQPIPTRSGAAFDGLLKPIPVSRPSSSSSGIRTPVIPAASSSRTTAKSPLAWNDDDDFLSSASTNGRPSASTTKTTGPADPWDFDQLAAVEPVKSQNGTRGGSGMRTPDPDFDFGEWKDMEGSSSARPSDSKFNGQRRLPERNTIPDRAQVKSSGRPGSPPPHIVGQIVEMGFSPAQARTALAKTSTGIDVQAALDGLLAQAFQSPPSPDSGPEDLGEVDDEYIERQRIRREEEERERRRKRRQGPSRDTIAPRSREEQVQQRNGNGNGTPIQADQILAQASEIGQSVFTKATSLWNTGKERALKAYEEQKRVYEAQLAEKGQGHTQGQARVKDGRPRWMVEAEVGREEGREGPSTSGGGFRDDDGEEIEQKPVRRARPRADEIEDRNGGRHRAPAVVSRTERPGDDLLFGEDIGSGPSRPRRPVEPTRAPRVTTPATPLPVRKLVSADPSAVQSSLTHKAKGNEHFKLGRFTEAENSYSTAITYLSGGHLHLVPLYNNRAATRLKLGDSKGSSEDCSSVIEIIGPTYHPSKEAPLPGDLGDEVRLADAYVKAHTKRAQAWEMGEKWKNAVEDWERVLGFDAALIGSGPVAGKTRNLAAEGLRRSKQMLDGGSSSRPSAPTTAPGSRTATQPKPKPRPPVASKPAQVDRSEAVSSLRAAAKVSEAEDQQRLALKDSVEGRLNTWRGGKETNLRALLASLDTVLWDEILAGGLKVGMHELITEKQVKIKYMKVIARLHPDKLDVNKTTVEQRMLANGAFGTLNEAWQAFNNA